MTSRILVIEDNKDLALGLRVNLTEHAYQVQLSHTAADGLSRMRQFQPHLLILDLSLPDGDGLDLLRRLRSSDDTTLVLVLTATSQQDVKVRGLRGGADDYLTKPFDLEELLVRIEVLLRRASRAYDPPALPAPEESLADVCIGDVAVDPRARTAHRAGIELALSRIEFDLLLALARRRGQVVSRAELMRDVWGYGEDVLSRTLDTHIFALRRRIEPDPSEPRYIRTVWRIGYRLE